MSGDVVFRGPLYVQRREADRLRREPALLSALLDAPDLPVFVLDAKGRIVLVNPACEVKSGRSAEELYGLCPWEVLTEKPGADWSAAFDPIRPDRLPLRQELVWRTKDGGELRIAWWTTTLADAEGIPRYVVCAGADRTELRELESRTAEVSERERERLGQDLHDGLGQELTALSIGCALLRDKVAARAPDLAEEAERIQELVQNAMGKTRSLAKGVYPTGLISSALPEHLQEMTRFVGKTFGARCELEWDADGEGWTDGVARNVYWIIQEAVTNAVRHGGSRRIQVSARREKEGIRIRVKDDGKGLCAEANPQGLGLRVMKSRAQAIGANLTIADHPEGGVLVECEVPDLPEEST